MTIPNIAEARKSEFKACVLAIPWLKTYANAFLNMLGNSWLMGPLSATLLPQIQDMNSNGSIYRRLTLKLGGKQGSDMRVVILDLGLPLLVSI